MKFKAHKPKKKTKLAKFTITLETMDEVRDFFYRLNQTPERAWRQGRSNALFEELKCPDVGSGAFWPFKKLLTERGLLKGEV